MSNQFINLPAPSADGSGAAVDVSSCGAMKTIVSSGDSIATLNVEINNDVAHAGSWSPVGTFVARGILRLMLACRWMRVTVSRYTSGTPQIDFGSSTDGTTFAALPVTAGDGTGAAVDVSALGLFKTVQVGGPFAGIVNVEISEDGNTKWATLFTFDAPGQQSLPIEARWMRVVRAGQKPMIPPGTPIVTVGGTDAGGSGVVGQTALKNEVVVPDIGGATLNNLNPAGFDGLVNVIRVINTDPNSVINGVKAQANGTLLLIVADSGNSQPFLLAPFQNGVNGFLMPVSVDPGNGGARLNANAAVLFCYNATIHRWVAVGAWLDELGGTIFVGLVQMQNGLDIQQGGLALGGPHNPTTGTLIATGLLQYFGSFNQDFEFQTSVLTPAALPAGVTNDYAPAGIGNARVLRLANGGAASLGGLEAPFAGGQKLTIRNLSAANLTLIHESGANPTLIQRFQLPGAANVVIPQFGFADLWYDGVTSRWTAC